MQSFLSAHKINVPGIDTNINLIYINCAHIIVTSSIPLGILLNSLRTFSADTNDERSIGTAIVENPFNNAWEQS